MTPNLIRSVAAACLAAALMPAQEEHEVIVLPKGQYSVTKGGSDAKSRTKLITIVEQLSDESTSPAERKKLKRTLLKLLGDADEQAKGVGVVEVQDVAAEAEAGGWLWRVSQPKKGDASGQSGLGKEWTEAIRQSFEGQDPVKSAEAAKESKGNALRLRAKELRAQWAKPGAGEGEHADEVAVVVESNGSEEPHIRYLDWREARSAASKARSDAAAARVQAMKARDEAMRVHDEAMNVHAEAMKAHRGAHAVVVESEDASDEPARFRFVTPQDPKSLQVLRQRIGKLAPDVEVRNVERFLVRDAEGKLKTIKSEAGKSDGFTFEWRTDGDDAKGKSEKGLKYLFQVDGDEAHEHKGLLKLFGEAHKSANKGGKGNVIYFGGTAPAVAVEHEHEAEECEECEEGEGSEHNDGEVLEMIEAMRGEMRELRTMIEEIRNSLRGNRAGPMVTRDRSARLAPAAVRKEDATPPRLERVREVRSIK